MARRLIRRLAGGALGVEADEDVSGPVEAWLPLSASAPAVGGPAAARILVSGDTGRGDELSAAPTEGPTLLRLGTVSVRRSKPAAGEPRLAAPIFALQGSHGLRGVVDLEQVVAHLHLPDSEAGADAHFALTVSSALLLGRVGRALIHSAVVVPPAGRACLLVGDSRAGKSTTSANLARMGWAVLSDDHAVLWEDGDGDPETRVEGWLRRFHLDRGWREGRQTGQRVEVDPEELIPGTDTGPVPLGAVVFPGVRPERPTRLDPVGSADALARIIRQSPWLFADRAVAAQALGRMKRAASHPTFVLSLGRDTYSDPERLASILQPAFRPV